MTADSRRATATRPHRAFFGRLHHRIERLLDAANRSYVAPARTGHRGIASRCWASSAFLILLAAVLARSHRPRVLPAGRCRPDHHVPPLPVQPAPRRQPRSASLEVEDFIREQHPQRRAGDDRQRDGRRSRLVGGLHRQLRPAGRRHPHPADATSASSSAQEYAVKLRHAFDDDPGLRRPARQLQHRRHGLHRAEQRRRVADRHSDRGRQAARKRARDWPRKSATACAASGASPTPACCSASTPRT